MVSIFQAALLAVVTYASSQICILCWNLGKQVQQARCSGLPYCLSPVHVMNVAYWFLLAPMVALDRSISMKRVQKWAPWTVVLRIWQAGYTVFRDLGTDSFFLCSPSGPMLLTCDVHLVKQVLTRAHDFHAPVDVLGLYNIYGPTLAASEGEQWRLYRRITTPFFNQKTYGKVWKESLDKAERLCAQWSHGNDDARVADVKEQLMSKLNLRVIAKIFYDQELPYDAENAMKDAAPPGHALTFSEAINAVLSQLATVFSVPKWLLARSPFESHKKACQGFVEWQQYMVEMRNSVQSRLESAKQKEEPYFLESLVIASDTASSRDGIRPLTEAEVLGNMFFYVMAGFDTTSTTLSFVFLLLALYPSVQTQLQQELDRVLGPRATCTWDANKDVPDLLNGYLGAVISETLRLYHPVSWYARKAVRDTTVTTASGATCRIPNDTIIMIDVAAIGRHPGYWSPSTTPGDDTSIEQSPARDFNPARWLDPTDKAAAFPFSAGHRMCPGKRFAEVEMCAILARVFSQFSLRLEANPADVLEAEGPTGHGKAWLEQRSRERATEALYEGMGFGHGIYPKMHVPFRIVPRTKAG
ncbi:cytochrome P450 family member [Polyplosphaeria fusca]|uniref:Cytochrome P450 family member n=1 Tax=Polyplosphaeria fusca TaxID=682080 RepID=A0A9P4QR38_9PLEO|nr:cytochrome P450 family member [Polyplosphaeria fusca]